MNDVPLSPDDLPDVDLDKTAAVMEELVGRLSPLEFLSVCIFWLGSMIADVAVEERAATAQRIMELIDNATEECLNQSKGTH